MHQWVTVAFCFSMAVMINFKIMYVLTVEIHKFMVYTCVYIDMEKHIQKIRN